MSRKKVVSPKWISNIPVKVFVDEGPLPPLKPGEMAIIFQVWDGIDHAQAGASKKLKKEYSE